jgi:hypothetical protein
MKEKMTYVAIDADNVGESIGNAVLSNNPEEVSSISNNINSGVGIFSQWAEFNGGKIISSGSDEAILQVPVQSLDELEDLKQKYQEKTGFSISIGIGEGISDAAKALIYAKVNGKDQIIDYSSEIERALKESISGNLNEQDNQLEGGIGDEVDTEDLPQDELKEGIEHEKEHTENEDIAEEIATDHLSEDDDYYSDLEEMEDEDEIEDKEDTEEIEVPKDEVDGDYGSQEMADAQPEHEKEMSEEEEFIHDAQENREDELDDDIIEADEEEEFFANQGSEDEAMEDEAMEDEAMEDEAMEDEAMEDEAMDEMVEDGQEDIDLDGRPDEQEEHGEIDPETDDLDGDGDVEHEEAMAAKSGEAEEYSDEGDFEDEIQQDDDELESAIAQEMGAEEMPEEVMGEDFGDEESLDHESLKSVIYESLNVFKENRQYLEDMRQQNPDLYTSLIHTLQAMIEMAKELGYGDATEELAAEEPEIENEEISQEEIPEEMEGYQKSEIYIGLINKMKKAFEMFKSDPKTMEEVKEAIKKKKEKTKENSKKSFSKKKKAFAKKPKPLGKKKKKTDDKSGNDGSFCAKSHQKMRAAGKDCRSNEDKNSPLCSARKKFNCRGKNEEKGKAMDKSEKLANFLKKKENKLEKGREGTATKQTTKHVSKPHNPEGTQKGYKVKVIDNETGEARWVDGSRGLAKDPNGDPIGPGGKSPVSIKKPKSVKVPKMDKV